MTISITRKRPPERIRRDVREDRLALLVVPVVEHVLEHVEIRLRNVHVVIDALVAHFERAGAELGG